MPSRTWIDLNHDQGKDFRLCITDSRYEQSIKHNNVSFYQCNVSEKYTWDIEPFVIYVYSDFRALFAIAILNNGIIYFIVCKLQKQRTCFFWAYKAQKGSKL